MSAAADNRPVEGLEEAFRRRLEVLELFGEEGRFDFDAAERAWGGGA